MRSLSLASQVDQVIEELQGASIIREMRDVSRVTSAGEHFRIRIRKYRLGKTLDGETAILRGFLPRGEIYSYFPRMQAQEVLQNGEAHVKKHEFIHKDRQVG